MTRDEYITRAAEALTSMWGRGVDEAQQDALARLSLVYAEAALSAVGAWETRIALEYLIEKPAHPEFTTSEAKLDPIVKHWIDEALALALPAPEVK